MAHEQAKEALREVETRLKEAQSECELAKKARDAVVAAPSKDWPPAINEAMHAAEAKQADPEEHDPGWAWDTTKWLDSIKTSKWVAEALLRPLRAKPSGTAGGSAANAANLTELQFLRALGDPDKVSDENRVGAILWLLKKEDLWMKTAATNIAAKLRDLHSAAAVSSEMQFGRFVRDTPLLKYDSVSSFFGGLEERVGRPTPNKDLVDEIRREHEEGKDAEREFTTRNYNVKTTSKMEWKFVKSPEETRREGWPEEDPNRLEEVYHRKPKEKDDDLKTTMDSKNKELQGLAKLQLAEAYGAMLYTGPMYMKYNAVLRGLVEQGELNGDKELRDHMVELCCSEEIDAENKSRSSEDKKTREELDKRIKAELNRYTTTLHTINSAVVKLSKLTKVTTVYRGLSGRLMPKRIWEHDEYKSTGGVEAAFMSTSTNKDVAMHYATMGDRKVRFLMEMQQGQVDRGADVSAFSQYPHEKEILFGPLASLEVLDYLMEGKELKLVVRLNINLNAPTIEKVVSKMRDTHVQMIDTLIVQNKQLMATDDELEPLKELKKEALDRKEGGKDGGHFNRPLFFEERTKTAMEAHRKIFLRRLEKEEEVVSIAGGKERGVLDREDQDELRDAAVTTLATAATAQESGTWGAQRALRLLKRAADGESAVLGYEEKPCRFSDGTGVLYGDPQNFFMKLSEFVRWPANPNILQMMQHEHCKKDDSNKEFTVRTIHQQRDRVAHTYEMKSMPRIEWWFVADPDVGAPDMQDSEKWPKYVKVVNVNVGDAAADDVALKREVRALQYFKDVQDELLANHSVTLSDPELIAARLFTGPMHTKYNAALRGIGNARLGKRREAVEKEKKRRSREDAADEKRTKGEEVDDELSDDEDADDLFMSDEEMRKFLDGGGGSGRGGDEGGDGTAAEIRLHGNSYPTTLNLLNSAVIKLSTCRVKTPVYRFIYSDYQLPESFTKDGVQLSPEENFIKGATGIEFGFLCCCIEKETPPNRKENEQDDARKAMVEIGGPSCILLEITLGPVDFAADLTQVSQFPPSGNIREIVLPALSLLELVDFQIKKDPGDDNHHLVVKMRTQNNDQAQTVDQELGKLGRSHVQLLGVLKDELRYQNVRTVDLWPLHSLEIEASAQDPSWFSIASNHQSAVSAAFSTQLEVIRSLVPDTSDRTSDKLNKDKLKEIAKLAARAGG